VDDPEAIYERIREQVRTGPSAGTAGLVACAVFLVSGLLLLLLLGLGTDVQQILLVAIGVTAVNLVLGVTWVSMSQRGG
jgi:hypothetical protein